MLREMSGLKFAQYIQEEKEEVVLNSRGRLANQRTELNAMEHRMC